MFAEDVVFATLIEQPHSSVIVAMQALGPEAHFFAASRADASDAASDVQSAAASAAAAPSAASIVASDPASPSGVVDQSRLHALARTTARHGSTRIARSVAGPPRFCFKLGLRRMPRHRARSWVLGLVVIACARAAHADGPVDEARATYEAGTRAYEHADYDDAAKAYARADELVPSATALRAAIDAAVLARDAVLAIALADRAQKRPFDAELATSAAQARAKLGDAVGRLSVVCDRCSVTVDREAAGASDATLVAVGAHTVRVVRDGVVVERVVDVSPRAEARARFVPPSARVSPAWLVTAGALTAASVVTTSIFAADTVQQHDRFVASGCLHSPACASAAQSGQDAQLRTNVALGVTIGLAVGTAIVAWLVTRGHGPRLELTP